MISLKSNGKPIGQAGIDELDFLDKRGEIFFLIGNEAEKGKGYSHETIRLLIDFAFKRLKLNSLYATATVKNLPYI